MLMLALVRSVSLAAGLMPWLLNLATRLLACSLQLPEPVVQDTGAFVFAQVQAVETASARRSARSACCVSSGPGSAEPSIPPATKGETAMIQSSQFLRRALLADAVFSGMSALGLTFGAGALASLLNLPEALLRETGLFLIAYTALVGWLGTRQIVPKLLVVLVVAGNAAWTIASIALLFSGAASPNLLGEIVVVAQAIATGVFAELQFVGLRKSEGAVAA